MNIENDFLTDFDLFGKHPEIYYKGKSKKASTLGLFLTIIYIILYISFLIYKFVRMIRRVDVTFYDSYTFQGLPSINITNNEFYAAMGLGGIMDERMYYLTVDYVRQKRVNGQFVDDGSHRLDLEICQLEKFGKDYQEIFKDQHLENYYCIKNFSNLVLEGYSNLERYSYFNAKFYPCVGKTKDGIPCYDEITKLQFFTVNTAELKIQDNDLNPTDYKIPVLRRRLDINSPVFLEQFQLAFSYLQIVNIETDEDLTGLNFFTDTIRKQEYTRYDETFIIPSPLLYGNILKTGGPIIDVTLQLAAKVLTERRQYTQLIDVLGDVGGLMEILYSFLNIITSFVIEILYDKTLVNNLFSFDLNNKFVVFNRFKKKIQDLKEDKSIKDLHLFNSNKPKQKFEDIENNKNVEIYLKDNTSEQKPDIKNNVSSTRNKIIKKKKIPKNLTGRTSINIREKSKALDINDIQKEKNENNEKDDNKISYDENKNILPISNLVNSPLGTFNESNISTTKDLKNIYINNWLIYCFWCTSRKKNLNKLLFEEGSKVLTERLDVMNMFQHLYIVEILKEKLGIEPKGIKMSENSVNNFAMYFLNNK